MNLDALVGAILAGMLILLLGVVFVSGVILHFMLWLSSGIINLGLGIRKRCRLTKSSLERRFSRTARPL